MTAEAIRLAAADSAAARALTAAVGRLRRARVPQQPVDPSRDRMEQQALSTMVRGSFVAVPVRAVAGACATAWRHSAARRRACAVLQSAAEVPLVDRIRAAGIWLGMAALVDAALRAFDPRPASIYRSWLWAVAMIIAIALVIAAEGIAGAWRSRRPR